MRFFSKLYDRVMRWVAHPHAQWYLGGLSFAESSFFPIPPDVMLAPMTLARPAKGWYFALLTTVTSVAGGILGYFIGFFAIEIIEPYIQQFGYVESYHRAQAWFEEWGFWAIFLAGFSPIPYKIFTITAGALTMPFLPFTIASFIGRGARFFLVSALIIWGGEKVEEHLRRHIDLLGWLTVLLAVIAYFVYKY
ncbi:MAG: DedA family protein [Gammaproteobacteria bacterium]|nr:DedA family protein [Gammaproteobacteria bacterium]